jgi:ATP-dependent DNA ligase
MTLPIIDPQDCRGTFKEELWNNSEWWAEHKLHGCRYLLYSDGRLLSRHNSVNGTGYVNKIDRTPQFINAARILPDNTILDGEIITHEFGNVREVTSILGSDPDLAIQKQKERGWLQLRVFDMPFSRGEDLRHYPLNQRRRALEEWFDTTSVEHVSPIPIILENKKEFCKGIMAKGGEGIILKWSKAKYGEKKYWVKVKQKDTFDVFVIGFKPANEESEKVDGTISATKYAMMGWIGAIEIGMLSPGGEIIPVGFCSGFDEATRKLVSENQDQFMGQVLEIEAQSQLPTGKFEHPRFIRWRDDKPKGKCIWWKG